MFYHIRSAVASFLLFSPVVICRRPATPATHLATCLILVHVTQPSNVYIRHPVTPYLSGFLLAWRSVCGGRSWRSVQCGGLFVEVYMVFLWCGVVVLPLDCEVNLFYVLYYYEYGKACLTFVKCLFNLCYVLVSYYT